MSSLRPAHPGASSGQRARHKLTSLLTAVGLATIGIFTGVASAAPAQADTACPAVRGLVTCTFSFFGITDEWIVPAEAAGQPIQIVATGQAGRSGTYGTSSAAGGLGATVSGSFSLTPGTKVAVLVPGGGTFPSGVFGGGGAGGYISNGGLLGGSGSGGGRAQVSVGSQVLVVAGGGGGGGASGDLEGITDTYFPGGAGGNAGLLKGSGSPGAPAPAVDLLDVTGGSGGGGASSVGTAAGTPGLGGVGGDRKPRSICSAPVTGATGQGGGHPTVDQGGSAATTNGAVGLPGGAGGGGWAGGGAGGQGGSADCLFSYSHGPGGGGGGGSSYVDSSVLAGTAGSALATGRAHSDNGQVQFIYRLAGSTATLTPARWSPGGVTTGGILDHVDIAFDRAVTGLTTSAFSLTRDGVAVSLAGTSITGSGKSYTLQSLVIATIPEGRYVLTLAASSAVVDSRGTPLANDVTLPFLVDGTSPTLTFNPVSTPRETKVDAVSYTLSEPTPGGLFDYPAYRLTRDGVAVSVPLPFNTASSDRKTFTFANLGEVTKAQGTYVFTVPANAIHDASDNPLAKDATLTWYTDAAPTATWDAIPTPGTPASLPRRCGSASRSPESTCPTSGCSGTATWSRCQG